MSFYEVLGVRRDASNPEIERAYKQLARRFHPDLNAGDREAEPVMKELNLIRATLTDPERRAAYDDKLRQDRSAHAARSTDAARAAHAARATDASRAGPPAPMAGVAWMNTASAPGQARPSPRRAGEPSSNVDAFMRVAGIVVGSALVIGLLLLFRHLFGRVR